MQTKLHKNFLQTSQGDEANSILRACVHCGFCTATCPTYQLLGDELDSPRGRIYLIKQVLEGQQISSKTRSHLDRCLSCRACETTCPSGVRYGRLIDIGREIVEQQAPRSIVETTKRFLLRKLIPYPKRFSVLLGVARAVKPLLPDAIKNKIPDKQQQGTWPSLTQQRKMLVLGGCAQKAVTAQTNISAAKILNQLGIELIDAKNAGCCGAVSHHLSAINESHNFIKRNIDAWWPYIEQGVEAIVITASGCGVMIKEYGEILKEDMHYAEKAKRVSEITRDISEVLMQENLPECPHAKDIKVAFHSPCTLQHGQKLNGVVENILTRIGYELVAIKDSHLCCGSAGTYSILQADLSTQLLDNKLTALQAKQPDYIATANIGCQMHLATKADTPVIHWIELLDKSLS